MGEKTGHIIWNKLDRLDVTPTEALVLLALAHFGIDDLPLCHPRQRHICRKTHLSMTAVKTALAALKKKGLITTAAFASRRNNYSFKFLQEPKAANRAHDPTPPMESFEGYLHHSVHHECH